MGKDERREERQEGKWSSKNHRMLTIADSQEHVGIHCKFSVGLSGGLVVKKSTKKGTWVQSLGREDPKQEMATHSSVLAWEIPWTEEPGGLQPMGSQRVGHHLVNKQLIGPYRLVGSSHIQRTQTRAWPTAWPINTGGWSDDSLLRRTLLPTSFTEVVFSSVLKTHTFFPWLLSWITSGNTGASQLQQRWCVQQSLTPCLTSANEEFQVSAA